MKTLKRYTARISISVLPQPGWFLTIYADSEEEAVDLIKKSTQRDYIVQEVDDRFQNKLSILLDDILDISIYDLLRDKKAQITQLYHQENLDLSFEEREVIEYEEKKGIYSAGLNLWRQYPLNSESN